PDRSRIPAAYCNCAIRFNSIPQHPSCILGRVSFTSLRRSRRGHRMAARSRSCSVGCGLEYDDGQHYRIGHWTHNAQRGEGIGSMNLNLIKALTYVMFAMFAMTTDS